MSHEIRMAINGVWYNGDELRKPLHELRTRQDDDAFGVAYTTNGRIVCPPQCVYGLAGSSAVRIFEKSCQLFGRGCGDIRIALQQANIAVFRTDLLTEVRVFIDLLVGRHPDHCGMDAPVCLSQTASFSTLLHLLPSVRGD